MIISQEMEKSRYEDSGKQNWAFYHNANVSFINCEFSQGLWYKQNVPSINLLNFENQQMMRIMLRSSGECLVGIVKIEFYFSLSSHLFSIFCILN